MKKSAFYTSRKLMALVLTAAMLLSAGVGACIQASAAAYSKSILYGDVNNDGNINTVDARMVLQNIVGKQNLSGSAALAADVDGSNSIDTVDARLILQYIVGKIDIFPFVASSVLDSVYQNDYFKISYPSAWVEDDESADNMSLVDWISFDTGSSLNIIYEAGLPAGSDLSFPSQSDYQSMIESEYDTVQIVSFDSNAALGGWPCLKVVSKVTMDGTQLEMWQYFIVVNGDICLITCGGLPPITSDDSTILKAMVASIQFF